LGSYFSYSLKLLGILDFYLTGRINSCNKTELTLSQTKKFGHIGLVNLDAIFFSRFLI